MREVLHEVSTLSPDAGANGFLGATPNPYRYDGNHELDPFEVSGMLAAQVPAGARVLDVGCGTGALSTMLRDVRNASVFGVEPDADRAALALERGISVHHGVLTPALRERIGQFDVVIYADVLEHLADPLAELRIASQFVAPSGLILISVPNIAHWSVRVNLLRGRFRYAEYGIMDATHLRWFTEETTRQLAAQAGIDVVSVQQTAGVMLQCYRESRLSKLPEAWRSRQVRRLSRRFPRLFGCQHIVVGRLGAPVGRSLSVTSKPRYVTTTTSPAVRPRLVGVVLPQFHPTPENDEWWGRGFTEWTNVTKSVPLFRGHVQPHLPADLGFYDLRLPEARAAQAELAQRYGIEGFCYYHYWFHGRRLLHQPIDDVLASGEPNFPFFFCWANEPWSRTWLGDEKQLLMAQRYSREDDEAHARWLTTAFADSRYMKTDDGRPIFMIYRPSHIDAPAQTIEIIRNASMREGLPDPYIVVSDGHEPGSDLRGKYGADMTLRFEPQLGAMRGSTTPMSAWGRLVSNFQHSRKLSTELRLFDYAKSRALMRAIESRGPAIRTVLVGWDNSPRRGSGGAIMTGVTPQAFGRELQSELARPDWNSSGTRILMLNAWNEWAEGNYLEPDQQHGHAYLEQVREALEVHARQSGLHTADVMPALVEINQ